MAENEQRGSTKLAVKAGFWYVVSNFLVKALSFVTTPIFSRLMSFADYGEFSNYASWQATLLIITGAELHGTLSRAYYDFTEEYDKYVSSITYLSILITFILYCVFLNCQNWIYNIVAIPPRFVHILFFTLLFQECKLIFFAKERTLYRYKSVAAISVINLVIPTLIAVVMVLFSDVNNRLDARVYGFYGPSAMIGACCVIAIFWNCKEFHAYHCKYALKLSMPLMVHYLTVYLLASTNTIVTKSILGAEMAAVISIATSAIHILTILYESMANAATTWIMDNLQQKKEIVVRRGLLLYVAGIAVIAIGVMLLSPEIIWILGGQRYRQCNILMPGMIVATFLQAITTLFTVILTYQKKVTRTAVYTAIIAALSIACKITLLPKYGVEILPLVNAVAFGLQFIISYFLIKKYGCATAINIKGFFLVIIAVLVTMVFSYYLYANSVMRYLIIMVMGSVLLGVVYKKRAIVAGFLKKKIKK